MPLPVDDLAGYLAHGIICLSNHWYNYCSMGWYDFVLIPGRAAGGQFQVQLETEERRIIPCQVKKII